MNNNYYKRLEGMTTPNLQIEIKKILNKHSEEISYDKSQPFEIVTDIYNYAVKNKKFLFETRLKECIAILLNEYNDIYDSGDYLLSILFLCGLWRIVFTYSNILRLVKQRFGMNTVIVIDEHDFEINTLLLNTLIQVYPPDEEKVVEKLLAERIESPYVDHFPQHFIFCFQELIKINHNHYLQQNFRKLIDNAIEGFCYLPNEIDIIAESHKDVLSNLLNKSDPFPMQNSPLERLLLSASCIISGNHSLYDNIKEFIDPLYINDVKQELQKHVELILLEYIQDKLSNDRVVIETHAKNISTLMFNNEFDHNLGRRSTLKLIFKYFQYATANMNVEFVDNDEYISYSLEEFINQFHQNYIGYINTRQYIIDYRERLLACDTIASIESIPRTLCQMAA